MLQIINSTFKRQIMETFLLCDSMLMTRIYEILHMISNVPFSYF
jgi:hypothetical protein